MGNLPVPEKKHRKPKLSLPKTAMSLKPGAQLMDALVQPKADDKAIAIQEFWKFNRVDPATGNPLHKITLAEEILESTPLVVFAATRWNEGKTTKERHGDS